MNELPASSSELPPRDFGARLVRRAPGIGSHRRRKHYGRRALALLAAIAVPAFATPGAWSNSWDSFSIGDAGKAEIELQPMPFEKTGESFPGSAFYYLSSDEQVLDSGTHQEGMSAPTELNPFSGPAARSLRATGTPVDQMRALTCLTQAIYYEAASEPDDGQRAVAQVVLNRVAHPAYPNSVCGVVYQGSERVTGCQFSFTCDGALNRVPSRMFWLRAENVARAALAGYVYRQIGLATHYHTIAVHPYWAPSLHYLMTLGAHRFYAMKGPAGSSGAFNTAVYTGNEPAAAPRPRSAGPAASDASLDPLAIQRAYAAGLKEAQDGNLSAVRAAPVPSYAPEVQARGGDKLYRGEKLPEAHGIKPEFQNSGTWISQPGT